jgi:hypothetical protein
LFSSPPKYRRLNSLQTDEKFFRALTPFLLTNNKHWQKIASILKAEYLHILTSITSDEGNQGINGRTSIA